MVAGLHLSIIGDIFTYSGGISGNLFGDGFFQILNFLFQNGQAASILREMGGGHHLAERLFDGDCRDAAVVAAAFQTFGR